MNIDTIEMINVKGISVRTDNATEMDPSTAQIGSLWEAFYSNLAPSLTEKSRILGLYTNYESDHTGAFDVVACADDWAARDLKGVSHYQIPSGRYLVFKGSGKMPQAVIALWGKVWGYFDSDECAEKRAFATDFELYKSENNIEIFISIEDDN